MTKKKEIEKINQIYDKGVSKPIDSYIRLYSQVVREVSESLRQKTNLLNIYISEDREVNNIPSDSKIHHHFKKLQKPSKI
jgi:hypothetical protein